MSETTKFEYLLNTMDAAGVDVNPFRAGYGEKRKSVMAHEAKLRALLKRCRAELIDDGHAYNGLCPEPGSLDARDPDCPAGALIVEIEEETL